MNHKLSLGLATTLSLTLIGCGDGSPGSRFVSTHVDEPSVIIDANNALNIAAAVYQVAAVDVPFTAALAMDPSDSNAINSAACTDATAISSGSSSATGMMDSGMGMNMVFNSCTLSSSPSTHSLIVNGSCNNVDGSSLGIEVVSGEKISFVTQGSTQDKTLALHNFAITRYNDNMTLAVGSLHLDNGDVVNFATPSAFTGTAMAPTAGSLVVIGASKSRLRLTIVNPGPGYTGFTLEVDANGDGIYDQPQPPSEQNWNDVFWMPLIP